MLGMSRAEGLFDWRCGGGLVKVGNVIVDCLMFQMS